MGHQESKFRGAKGAAGLPGAGPGRQRRGLCMGAWVQSAKQEEEEEQSEDRSTLVSLFEGLLMKEPADLLGRENPLFCTHDTKEKNGENG